MFTKEYILMAIVSSILILFVAMQGRSIKTRICALGLFWMLTFVSTFAILTFAKTIPISTFLRFL